jgi:hypothetical protein
VAVVGTWHREVHYLLEKLIEETHSYTTNSSLKIFLLRDRAIGPISEFALKADHPSTSIDSRMCCEETYESKVVTQATVTG